MSGPQPAPLEFQKEKDVKVPIEPSVVKETIEVFSTRLVTEFDSSASNLKPMECGTVYRSVSKKTSTQPIDSKK